MSGKNLRKILGGFFLQNVSVHTQIFRKNVVEQTQNLPHTYCSKPKSFENYGWNRKKNKTWDGFELACDLTYVTYIVFFGADYFCWKQPRDVLYVWCHYTSASYTLNLHYMMKWLYLNYDTYCLIVPYCNDIFFSRGWCQCYFPYPLEILLSAVVLFGQN